MTRRTSPRTPPCRQRSIYAPQELEKLRAIKPTTRQTVGGGAVERESSYGESLYAKRSSFMQPTPTTATADSSSPKGKSSSVMESSRKEISGGDYDYELSSRHRRHRRRRIKAFVEKRSSDATDLMTIYMLTQSLDGVAD